MKKIFFTLIFLLCLKSGISQTIITEHEIYSHLNNIAKAYLLNANRPYIEIETDIPEKNKYSLSWYPALGQDYVTLPVYGKYGLTDDLTLTGFMDFYTTAYSLTGKTSKGFGDIYAGVVYRFQESELFEHFIQPTVKFPTASGSSGVGTGKFDFDLGISQFFETEKVYYTITCDMDFVHKADFPSSQQRHSRINVQIPDSLKSQFDYSYEPVLSTAVDPGYYITKDLLLEGGLYFQRNTKLNFNFFLGYADMNYTFLKKFEVYGGLSFSYYKQVNYDYNEAYLGFNYNPSDNLTFGVSSFSSINRSSSIFVNLEMDVSN